MLADVLCQTISVADNRTLLSMAAQRVQLLPRAVYRRGVAACRKCQTLIPIQNLNTLPDEFSVRCPDCGDRTFYSKRAVAIQDMPERRRKPRH
jgi:RNase P subunit RPR2